MAEEKTTITVCVGVRCSSMDSKAILHDIEHYIIENKLEDKLTLTVRNCFGQCGGAPNVKVGGKLLGNCSSQSVITEIEKALAL
ncbi:MAG: NAD(P)H-dependent oxidoreductase subunit E [Phycisphaerae bacterium]